MIQNPPQIPLHSIDCPTKIYIESVQKRDIRGSNVTEMRQADEPTTRGKSIAEVADERQDE